MACSIVGLAALGVGAALGPDALAQQCASGLPADTIPNAGYGADGSIWPWQAHAVLEAAPPILRQLGFVVGETDKSSIRTAAHYGWPDDPLVEPYKGYEHPGVRLTLHVEALGDSSRVSIAVRALCRIDRPPPDGLSHGIEDAMEFAFAEGFAARLLDAVLWRQDRLRRVGPVYVAEAVERLPVRLSCPQGYVPSMLQRTQRDKVTVRLEFVVDTAGQVERESIVVVESPHREYSAAAVQMVRGCRFLPGVKDGSPVRVLVSMPVNFTLNRPD